MTKRPEDWLTSEDRRRWLDDDGRPDEELSFLELVAVGAVAGLVLLALGYWFGS